jgi:hypothetical protein
MDNTPDGDFSAFTLFSATFTILKPTGMWTQLSATADYRLGTSFTQVPFAVPGPGQFARTLAFSPGKLQPGQPFAWALDDWDPKGGPVTVMLGDAVISIPNPPQAAGSFLPSQATSLCTAPLRAYQAGYERTIDVTVQASQKLGYVERYQDQLNRPYQTGDLLCDFTGLLPAPAAEPFLYPLPPPSGPVAPIYVLLGPPPTAQTWTDADLTYLWESPKKLPGIYDGQAYASSQFFAGTVFSASNLKIPRTTGGPASVPMTPVIPDVATYDPKNAPVNTVTVFDLGTGTVLGRQLTATSPIGKNYYRASGSVKVEGNLDAENVGIYVDGDLTIHGNLTCTCSVAATGNIEIDGNLTTHPLTDQDPFTIASNGTLWFNGPTF